MAYIGPEPNPGQNREVDDISSGFNGGTASFTLQVNGQNVSPGSSNNIIVSLGGVIQNPSTDYTIAGSTITFTSNPASGLSFFGLVLGQQVDIQSLADGTSPTMSAPTVTGSLSIADKIIHTGDTNNAIRFPAADTITAETSGIERVRIDSSGNIGVGTNSPTSVTNSKGITLKGTASSFSGFVDFRDSDNNNDARIHADNSLLFIEADPSSATGSSSIRFKVDGAEQARIADGISFNGDSADANFLNDYEEGTWTPSNTIGMPLTNTHTAQYVKIGSMCWVTLNVIFNSTPADSSQCGIIQGLPFTSANTASGEQQLPYFFISEGGGTATRDEDEANTVYFVGANESRIDIFSLGGSAFQTRAFLAGRRMRMNFCYRTA